MLFLLFQNFDFPGCYGNKKAKNGPRWQNILFVALHISGTIHHMIVIYGPFVQNDDISRYSFHFKILIFQVIREVKR